MSVYGTCVLVELWQCSTSGPRANMLSFHGGGWGSKQTGSHFLSQWLIWKKGNCSGGEEKGGKAATVQDAQAVVDRGCWVVVWR